MYQPTVEKDPKAQPILSPQLVEGLIKASETWTIADVREILAAWKMKNYYVNHKGFQLGIGEVLDRWTDESGAKFITVTWNSGPRGRHRVQSNIAHWLLDNLMWEVRLSIHNETTTKEKLSELKRLAGVHYE